MGQQHGPLLLENGAAGDHGKRCREAAASRADSLGSLTARHPPVTLALALSWER